MCSLLEADVKEWPLPWTSFALGEIPTEIPQQKLGGHDPKALFGPPFHRKLTPGDALSEQHTHATELIALFPAPETTPSLTELGRESPINAHGTSATAELVSSSTCLPTSSYMPMHALNGTVITTIWEKRPISCWRLNSTRFSSSSSSLWPHWH